VLALETSAHIGDEASAHVVVGVERDEDVCAFLRGTAMRLVLGMAHEETRRVAIAVVDQLAGLEVIGVLALNVASEAVLVVVVEQHDHGVAI